MGVEPWGWENQRGVTLLQKELGVGYAYLTKTRLY